MLINAFRLRAQSTIQRSVHTSGVLQSKKKDRERKKKMEEEAEKETELFVIETREQEKELSILDKISNKRITRLESDIELESDGYQTRLMNRNPNNLQYLSFEKKPSGFWLDRDPPLYYNRVTLDQESRHLIARLDHWSGRTLIQASTGETNLAKYFKSPKTTQAANLLGKIFTIRCLRSGYLNAGACNLEGDCGSSQKTKAFFDSVVENGLVLEELPEIVPRTVTDI